MPKLTLEFPDEIPSLKALEYLSEVIRMGRISDYGKQYCGATRFEDGAMVYTHAR